ncbi:hypothetical protein F2Q69_00008251 [Brassica cretica]|uniref:Uncharacterized protein n=1 Tax=Brassica cretica TaxID=69181 RepID=A0A8S9PKZ7_BRACR|nr:hypothetical protein F2Q69_00008251 [Brassica cretica]
MINNGRIPSRCCCGKVIVTYVSKTEENLYRRFFRCDIGLHWADEALFDEIQRMDEQQSRIAKEIEDLRSSLNKTVQEEVIKQNNLADVGCLGSMLSILCL